jgi:hypothetical protein
MPQTISLKLAHDVHRIATQLTPLGFEGYVGDRFNRIPDWNAVVTPASKDQGADVIVTSPRGLQYIIQCKLVTSSIGSPEAQRTDGASIFYQVPITQTILLSGMANGTRDTAFTAEARRYADTTGLKLWTLEELQIVADAEAAGSDARLAGLGMDSTPITPVLSQQPTRNNPPSKRAFKSNWITMLLLPFVLIAMNSLGVTRVIWHQAKDRLFPTSPETRIQSLLEHWRFKFQAVSGANDLTGVEAFLMNGELVGVTKLVNQNHSSGCKFTFEELQTPVIYNIVVTGRTATAQVQENLTVRLVCPNLETIKRSGQTVSSYALLNDANLWKISSSVTKAY